MEAQNPDPRMVAVPAHPGAGKQLMLETRRLPEGLVLPMFTSVGLLIEALGQYQPWAIVSLPKVAEMASALGIDQLLLDPEVSDDTWRWEPDDVSGFSWEVR